MLMPKRVKYRRVQRGRMKGKATRGNVVTYGEFGLQAQEPGWITSNQIEAARIAMTRYTKRVQPDRSGPYRYDALHQARRSGLDQDLPRQARYREAGRDPYGFR